MPKTVKFSCDGCGAERKEANHWFTVDGQNCGLDRLLIYPFQDIEGGEHYCGEVCLHKRVAEFTGKNRKWSAPDVKLCDPSVDQNLMDIRIDI